MNRPYSALALAISVALLSPWANSQTQDNNTLEKITVVAPKQQIEKQAIATGNTTEPDLADWLNSVPGANVNKNGPTTGIAQYRGLFGDRVATSVNGRTIVSAGPNAMDAPLSYTTPLIVESMSVYRGIAPVSVAVDTLGGAVEVNMRQAQIHNSNLQLEGELQSGYRERSQAKTLSAWSNVSMADQALMVYGNWQQADNKENADGQAIVPTHYSKSQAGFDFRQQLSQGEIGASYHYTDTHDAGTPALPMDILYIYGNRLSIDGQWQFNHWQFNGLVGLQQAKHEMDNFSHRANMMAEMFRNNFAESATQDYKFTLSNEQWLIGFDAVFAQHDSTITNPNNAMFNIANFNAVSDDRAGIFIEYKQALNDNTNLSMGGRIKHSRSDAGQVSHHMAMMNDMIASRVNQFNQAERQQSDSGFDLTAALNYQVSDQLSWSIASAVKQRAPSYQERYLWLPMEATGGLADGNTYIGNLNLDSETAYQLDLGFAFHNEKLRITPHVFYQQINDYIQGVTSNDMAVKMIASMMGDDNPLQFANLDATLYGADMRFSYQFSDNWQLNGHASYVRGTRDDINDNLYRIAPLNGLVNLVYYGENWEGQLRLKLAARQDKVSLINEEKPSAGYAVLNAAYNYYFNSTLSLRVGIDNLLNRDYADHLGGINRVTNNPVAVKAHLPNEGRNAWVELNYTF